MPSRRQPTTPNETTAAAAAGRRTGIFHRESTRLRSNVADQVQRDLLPAGRMLSVFLIVCELLAEVAVLVWSRGQKCDRPLRFWVHVLIVLQAGTVLLNCLNIWHGRDISDSFGQHRNGLSATDSDMYTDARAAPLHDSSSADVAVSTSDLHPSVVVHVSPNPHLLDPHAALPASPPEDPYHHLDTQPLLSSRPDPSNNISSTSPSIPVSNPASAHPTFDHPNDYAHNTTSSATSDTPVVTSTLGNATSATSMGLLSSASSTSATTLVSTEFVDKYVRIVNAWYLIWFILGSIWVSDGGTCSTTAPHLYRLIVALTIIYYALLFLPLACFCLIVCCLPLFILVYRIMLPYAERERRRARAADPALVQNLTSIAYSAQTFTSHSGHDNLDDASCVICLCDYEENEIVRFLPCKHHFHKDCVDVWLRLDKACCLCKQDIDATSAAPPSPISTV